MYFDRKAANRYLKRRHKLYKSVTNYVHSPQQTIVSVVQSQQSVNKDNGDAITINNECQIALEKIKHTFIDICTLLLVEKDHFDIFTFLETLKPIKNHLQKFSKQFLTNILISTQFQSGRKLAYILYRLCKDNPQLFKPFNSKLRAYVIEKYKMEVQFNIQQCIFLTDLYLYGFYFTARGYLERIFVQTKNFIIDFIPRMPPFNQWSVFMPKRYLFKLKNQSENWINDLIKYTKTQYSQLLDLEQHIKLILVEEKKSNKSQSNKQSNEEKNSQEKNSLSQQYSELYEKYEVTRSKLECIEKSQGLQEAKQLQKVIDQCTYFDPTFKLPTLLYNLYVTRVLPTLTIQRIKPAQMLSLYDDQAFISQLRSCPSIQKAVDLGAYFVANLSTQKNREQLIQFVIDYCHNQGNLDLIIKVMAQINCTYNEIGEYLAKKATKIASQIKMNKKYLNLICQSIKYGLIPSDIILSYINKRLLTQHTEMSQQEIIRECCSILEILGQGIYHQSLENNIQINKLLKMIEDRILEKKLGTEFLFNLKCVKNYLRKAHCLHDYVENAQMIKDSETLSQLTQDYNLNDHFDFILKRIKQLLHTKSNNKTQQTYNKKRVVNYIVNSIENQSNFIQTFLQASLVKQINHKELKQEVLEKTTDKIQSHIGNDIQHAIKWSRFLGELYNYEILNRKQLSTILQTKLLYSNELSSVVNFQQMTKCIIECLNTSKSYILESELNKETNQYIINFLVKFKRSILKYLQAKQSKGRFNNVMIEQQVGQLLQFFHPSLLNKLKTVEQIDLWVQKVKFSSPKDTLLSVNLYKILNFYQQIDKITQFDPTFLKGAKKLQKFQEKTEKTNKKPLYKQKTNQPQHFQNQVKSRSCVPKINSTSISQIQKQIKQINENFRNQQTQETNEEQQQLIKQQQMRIETTLKQMMGITPQVQLDQKFPQLNQKNLKAFTKTEQSFNALNNMRKILKNSNGKKMKIIGRKVNQINFQVQTKN